MSAAVATIPTISQRIKLVIVALLIVSLGIGITATPQSVAAKPRTTCNLITDALAWYTLTGRDEGPDFVGGYYCYKV